MAPKITKAVIPAAGLGTRFLPATKAMPKEMLPVVDKPAIQYVVEEAVAAGLTDVLMITGRNKSALENHFDRIGELEATLERKGDTERLEKVNYSTDLADVHYVRQGEPGPRSRRRAKSMPNKPSAASKWCAATAPWPPSSGSRPSSARIAIRIARVRIQA